MSVYYVYCVTCVNVSELDFKKNGKQLILCFFFVVCAERIE